MKNLRALSSLHSKLCYKTYISKDLLGEISFQYVQLTHTFKINFKYSYLASTGNTYETVLSLMVLK